MHNASVSDEVEPGERSEPRHHPSAAEVALERLDRLERGRRTGVFVAIGKRFNEVTGLDQSGLLSIELFTTIIPLIAIGFAYFRGFARDASVGDLLVKQMNLHGDLASTVRATFGSPAALRRVWSVTELATFLFWGIPMSISVSRMFALAWRREPFALGWKILRGFSWFLLYLVTIATSIKIAYVLDGNVARVVLFMVSSIPYFIFWAVTPVILVRDGGKGWLYLGRVGLAGLVIDAIVLRLAGRIAFPILLSGWQGFGPIGVAMTLMTWCGVLAVGWVVTACTSAVLWERAAPTETVLDAQSDRFV